MAFDPASENASHRKTFKSVTKNKKGLQGYFNATKEDPLFFIDGQLCQHLRKIFQDSQGRLWFGTNVYDLMLYDGDSLRYMDEKSGFSGGRITGIVEDKNQNLWFGTAYGLCHFDGSVFRTYPGNTGEEPLEIWSLLLDSKGLLWLGHSDGLSRFDGENFEHIKVPKPEIGKTQSIYSPDRISAVVEDQDGNLWLGTDGYGLCKYDGKAFTHYTLADGLPDHTISELLFDSKGGLWIGTFWGGLSHFDGERFSNFTKNNLIKGVEISALYEDQDGSIWIGVENNGVYKYQRRLFKHYNQKAFHQATILSVYQDRENRMWFGGWGGLFRMQNDQVSPVTRSGPWN